MCPHTAVGHGPHREGWAQCGGLCSQLLPALHTEHTGHACRPRPLAKRRVSTWAVQRALRTLAGVNTVTALTLFSAQKVNGNDSFINCLTNVPYT